MPVRPSTHFSVFNMGTVSVVESGNDEYIRDILSLANIYFIILPYVEVSEGGTISAPS